MFTLNVRKLFRKTFGSWQTTPPMRLAAQPSFRPVLEVLEDRYLLSGVGPDATATAEFWCAPASAIVSGGNAANWNVATNWSQDVVPGLAVGALFDPSAKNEVTQGTNTPCYIPAGVNLPIIPGLTIKDWSGTLTLNSNLAASGVTINPRTGNAGQQEVIINSGSNLYALQTLTWAGGNVSGSGNFEVGGNDTINGTSGGDKPTLGARMDVGTTYLSQYYGGNLVFSTNSQPLVVNQNANIYVNNNSKLLFNNVAPQGQSYVAAISNGDTLTHSIIVNTGGTLTRTNVCELYVAMGLDIEGGQVNVLNPQGQNTGNPLHFTRTNFDGSGLEITAGLLSLSGDLTSDNQGNFNGGTVSVHSGVTLTLGVNANSEASVLKNGTFILMGTLVPHGGFSMYGGIFGTGGSLTSTVNLDSGNQFFLVAGVIDVSQLLVEPYTAPGQLTINGDFSTTGGDVGISVDAANGVCGLLVVNGAVSGTVNINTADVNPSVHANKNWTLFKASSSANSAAPSVDWGFPEIPGADWSALAPQNAGGYWQMGVNENQ